MHLLYSEREPGKEIKIRLELDVDIGSIRHEHTRSHGQPGPGYRVVNHLLVKADEDDDPTNPLGPGYVALSHRWGKTADEVTFADMVNDAPKKTSKKGWQKLVQCCEKALDNGVPYVWIDTCCIQKESSAELSEAIASMYEYYAGAKHCYVYLDDVKEEEGEICDLGSEFARSKWFTRGWTLQELIAPSNAQFFNCDWQHLGERSKLAPTITRITGIDEFILRGSRDGWIIDPRTGFQSEAKMRYQGYVSLGVNRRWTLNDVSVAKRMSWASKRQTTRVEDRAYSLMGLFGVFIAPLYGEGMNAFIRLQEEIIRTSYDHSIFAWSGIRLGLQISASTMLAASPANFECSGAISGINHETYSRVFPDANPRFKYSMTNFGLSIRLPALQITGFPGILAVVLACSYQDSDENFDHGACVVHLMQKVGMPDGYMFRYQYDNRAGSVRRLKSRVVKELPFSFQDLFVLHMRDILRKNPCFLRLGIFIASKLTPRIAASPSDRYVHLEFHDNPTPKGKRILDLVDTLLPYQHDLHPVGSMLNKLWDHIGNERVMRLRYSDLCTFVIVPNGQLVLSVLVLNFGLFHGSAWFSAAFMYILDDLDDTELVDPRAEWRPICPTTVIELLEVNGSKEVLFEKSFKGYYGDNIFWDVAISARLVPATEEGYEREIKVEVEFGRPEPEMQTETGQTAELTLESNDE